jgi:hypothetical protein
MCMVKGRIGGVMRDIENVLLLGKYVVSTVCILCHATERHLSPVEIAIHGAYCLFCHQIFDSVPDHPHVRSSKIG